MPKNGQQPQEHCCRRAEEARAAQRGQKAEQKARCQRKERRKEQARRRKAGVEGLEDQLQPEQRGGQAEQRGRKAAPSLSIR